MGKGGILGRNPAVQKHTFHGGLKQYSWLLRTLETELTPYIVGLAASSAPAAYITFLSEFCNT